MKSKNAKPPFEFVPEELRSVFLEAAFQLGYTPTEMAKTCLIAGLAEQVRYLNAFQHFLPKTIDPNENSPPQ